MSPVQRTSGHAGRALSVAVVAIVIMGLALWGVSVLMSQQNSTDLAIGDQTFQGGSAERIAAEIADDGPILYPDASGSDERDLILQHLGDDPTTGWYAFIATVPGEERACTWQWDPEAELFTAGCDEARTLPADGEGAESFPVVVDDGKLDIDLNAAERTTTTTTSTTTTVVMSGNTPGG